MKAVLVIDMPENCEDCPCVYEEAWMCQVDLDHDERCCEGRPDWCPLKPLPEPLDLNKFPQGADTRMIAIGYNTFRDELLGDTK